MITEAALIALAQLLGFDPLFILASEGFASLKALVEQALGHAL